MRNNRVDFATVLFLSTLLLLILVSISSAYYKYIVLEDYEIYLTEEGGL